MPGNYRVSCTTIATAMQETAQRTPGERLCADPWRIAERRLGLRIRLVQESL